MFAKICLFLLLAFFDAINASIATPTKSNIKITLSENFYFSNDLFVLATINPTSSIPANGKVHLILPTQLKEKPESLECLFRQGYKTPICRRIDEHNYIGEFTENNNSTMTLMVSLFSFQGLLIDPFKLRILDGNENQILEYEERVELTYKNISSVKFLGSLDNQMASAISSLSLSFSLKYSVGSNMGSQYFFKDAVIKITTPIVNSYLEEKYHEGMLTSDTLCSSSVDYLLNINCTVINSTVLVLTGAFSHAQIIDVADIYTFSIQNLRNPADINEYSPFIIEIYEGDSMILSYKQLKLAILEKTTSAKGNILLSDSTLTLSSSMNIRDIVPQGAFYKDYDLQISLGNRRPSLEGVGIYANDKGYKLNTQPNILIDSENSTITLKNLVKNDFIRNSSFELIILNFKNDGYPGKYPVTLYFRNTKLNSSYEEISLAYSINSASLTGLSLLQGTTLVCEETFYKISFTPLLSYTDGKALVKIEIPQTTGFSPEALVSSAKISGSIDPTSSPVFEYNAPFLFIKKFKTTQDNQKRVTVELPKIKNPKFVTDSEETFSIEIHCDEAKTICESSKPDNNILSIKTNEAEFKFTNLTTNRGLMVGAESVFIFDFITESELPGSAFLEIYFPAELEINALERPTCNISLANELFKPIPCLFKSDSAEKGFGTYLSIGKFNNRDLSAGKSFSLEVWKVRNPKTYNKIGPFEILIRDNFKYKILARSKQDQEFYSKMTEKNTDYSVNSFLLESKKAGGKTDINFAFETQILIEESDQLVLKVPFGMNFTSAFCLEEKTKDPVQLTTNQSDSIIISLKTNFKQSTFNFTIFNVLNPKQSIRTWFTLFLTNVQGEILSEMVLHGDPIEIEPQKILELKNEDAKKLRYLGLNDSTYFSFVSELDIEVDELISVIIPFEMLFSEKYNNNIEVTLLYQGKEVKTLERTKTSNSSSENIIISLSKLEQRLERGQKIGFNITGFVNSFLEPKTNNNLLAIQIFSKSYETGRSVFAFGDLPLEIPKVNCHESCDTCSETYTNCLTCPTGFFRNNSSCVAECPTGTFPNGFNCQICNVLIGGCLSCNGERKICIKCEDSYYLTENNICVIKEDSISDSKPDKMGSNEAGFILIKDGESFNFKKVGHHLFITYSILLSLIYISYKKLTTKGMVPLLPATLLIWSVLENLFHIIFFITAVLCKYYYILGWIVFYWVLNFFLQCVSYRVLPFFLKSEIEYLLVISKGSFPYLGLDFLTKFWNFKLIYLSFSGLGLTGNIFTLRTPLKDKDKKEIKTRKSFYSSLELFTRGSAMFLFLYLAVIIFIITTREAKVTSYPVFYLEFLCFLFLYALLQAVVCLDLQKCKNEMERFLVNPQPEQAHPESSSIKMLNCVEISFMPQLSDERRDEGISKEDPKSPTDPFSGSKLNEAKTAISSLVLSLDLKDEERESIALEINKTNFCPKHDYFEEKN